MRTRRRLILEALEQVAAITGRLKLLPVGHRFTAQEREDLRTIIRLCDEMKHWAQIAKAESTP